MAATTTKDTGERGSYQIRALDRGLDILEAFSLHEFELTIGQISEKASLPKPTVIRLLSVLTERGWVERIADSGRYRLGVRTLEVSSVFLQTTTVEAEARPIMQQLADATGQTANLGILDRGQVVHIEVVAPDRPVRFWASIGKREDAYVSGLGKVLLSALPDPDLDAYLEGSFPEITSHTITDAGALRRDLEETSARGYAIDNEESNLGVVCVAAPIRNSTGGVTAAISISGQRAEFDAEGRMQEYVAQVQEAASRISARLGWTG